MQSKPAHGGSQRTAANRAEVAALDQRSTKSRALRQGMMQELLTGRTRLL